jgi:hypothetical protein
MKNKFMNNQKGFAPIIIALIVAILAIGGISYYAIKKPNISENININKPSLDNKDKLFVAQTYDDYLRIGVFDPSLNKLISYKEVKINPVMPVHSYNDGGIYLRFSPQTKDVYFVVRGNVDYNHCDEGGCDYLICPKIGECKPSIVYKVNINDSNSPVKIYDYVVDKSPFVSEFSVPSVGSFNVDDDNSISPNGLYSYKYSHGFIDLTIEGQKEIKTLAIQNSHGIWSKDSKKFFYLESKKAEVNTTGDVRSLDTSTGKDTLVLTGKGLSKLWDLSYSGKYLAAEIFKVYLNKEKERGLLVYDLENKKELILPEQFKQQESESSGYDLVEWFR